MKKIISIMLIIGVIFTLGACSRKVTKDSQEVGIWSISGVSFDVEEMKQTYESEGLDWTEEDEAGLEDYAEFYKSFMGGFYLQFDKDGTGVLDFYNPESTESDTATPFTWKDGEVTYTDDGDEVTDLTYIFNGDNLIVSEEGTIFTFDKVNSLKDIENTEFWKEAQELESSWHTDIEGEVENEDEIIVEMDDFLDEVEESSDDN